MTPDSPPPVTDAAPQISPPPAPGRADALPAAAKRWLLVLGALALCGAAGSLLVWQKLANVQQQLARQSADSGLQATQALATARQAQEQAMDTAAKLSVTEAKLAEVSLQRTQLEELMQSLSRSRDENLVVDIDASLRLAQQQSQLSGSIEPLLAALKSADARVARASQPRLAQLQRAIGRDTVRIKATTLADIPTLLIKLDELVSLADDLPGANAVGNPPGTGAANANAANGNAANAAGTAQPSASARRQPAEEMLSWTMRLWALVQDEIRSLVRVSRVEAPEAALLSPEQAFFVRENLKLRLLNARLGLMSRQLDSARSDLATASAMLNRYFDASSRKTQNAAALLQLTQSQMRSLDIPRIDETLAALATAAAGR